MTAAAAPEHMTAAATGRGPTTTHGISRARRGREAVRRLAVDGPNTLPHRSERSWPADVARQITHPLALLVSAAAVIYLPPLQAVFGTSAPPAWTLAALLPGPFLVWALDELFRARQRRRASIRDGSPIGCHNDSPRAV